MNLNRKMSGKREKDTDAKAFMVIGTLKPLKESKGGGGGGRGRRPKRGYPKEKS